MPLIPGVNQRSVTPDAANTPYFKIEATADEFGAGIGKSMLGLENGVIDAATTAVDVKQKLAEKAKAKAAAQNDNGYHIVLPMPQFSPDLSKAIDATNTFNAGAQDLTSNFLQLSGKDAVDGQAAAQQGIDQLKDQVLANASTPAAGDRAQQAVDHWADGAKSIIDRHATAQQRVYDDDLDNTQVALGANSVGLLYNDDQHYLTQLHVASQARADQVLRAAAIASAQQATASDFTRTRIESALGQDDLATATALHQRWGNDLLPADQDAVSQHLTYASFNQDSQQAATQAMSINQPASLGRQCNADIVLHRSGGGGAAGDQVADAGGLSATAPVRAGQGTPPQNSQPAKPSPAGSKNHTEPLFPEGTSVPAYRGEERVMGNENHLGDKLSASAEKRRSEALAAIPSLSRAKAWPLGDNHQRNIKDSKGTADGGYGWVRKYPDLQPKWHRGVDFKANIGDPVYAVEDGVVESVTNNIPLGGVDKMIDAGIMF